MVERMSCPRLTSLCKQKGTDDNKIVSCTRMLWFVLMCGVSLLMGGATDVPSLVMEAVCKPLLLFVGFFVVQFLTPVRAQKSLLPLSRQCLLLGERGH